MNPCPSYRAHPRAGRCRAALGHIGLFMILLAFATRAEPHHHHARGSGEAKAGQFDYYLLSLSWAPTYCLTHTDDGAECSGKGYGFVLHGLWPQYDAGGFPEDCPTRFQLSADAASKGRSIYPSARLMQHEWQGHGTCSGLDALSYFRTADRATASMNIPAALEAPRADQNLTAAEIADLFRAANPQMPTDALTVACSRGGLSEVRLCLTKDLAPRHCGRGVHTVCPSLQVAVPAAR